MASINSFTWHWFFFGTHWLFFSGCTAFKKTEEKKNE